jgi:hypothetical protein
MAPRTHNETALPVRLILVSFKMAEELIARIDGYAVRFEHEHPGVRCSRADAVRLLIELGLKGS